MENPDFDHQLEQAITFLVTTFQQSGNNPKPVILHSIRVALFLYEYHYPEETIIAGALHDLVEDTACTIIEIEENFGTEVAQLVSANTFSSKIADKTEQNREMFSRCKASGKMALLIKAADILDNSRYWHLLTDKELKKWLVWKIEYFLQLSLPELGKEQVWHKLSQSYQKLNTSIS